MTDVQIVLWYCEQCSESGALYIASCDVYGVLEALQAMHKGKSPGCSDSLAQLRIARPTSWFRDIQQRGEVLRKANG